MPRCLMAKKWKAYPWPDRGELDPAVVTRDDEEDDEEIDVVGDTSPIKTSVIRRVPGSVIQEGPGLAPTVRPVTTTTSSSSSSCTSSTSSASTTTTSSPHQPAAAHQQAGQTSGQACWSPASPTAGATAPSPPPQTPTSATLETRVSVLYHHGYVQELTALPFTAYLPQHPSLPPLSPGSPAPTYATLQPPSPSSSTPRRCFTSTGAQLSLPPKKKDIYRPYSLEPSRSTSPSQSLDVRPEDEVLQRTQYVEVARPEPQRARPITLTIARPIPLDPISYQPVPMDNRAPLSISTAAPDDLTAAHAILDLSASTLPYHRPPTPQPMHPMHQDPQHAQPQHQPHPQEHHPQQFELEQSPGHPESHQQLTAVSHSQQSNTGTSKTVSYTYEAFFVSDGRSKRKTVIPEDEGPASDKRGRYACGECGKRYATSSNLSRHKQTHRSLESGSARQCNVCGKAYVSMPALAMHVLTHQLTHACGVCGKLFSRPWLLQGHLRSHTGEKPYGCAHCGKAFADRSNLRAHMQTHSQDKSYSCHRCHKSFALKSYLNKHLESSCVRDGMSSSEESSLTGSTDEATSAFAAPNNMVNVSFPAACSA